MRRKHCYFCGKKTIPRLSLTVIERERKSDFCSFCNVELNQEDPLDILEMFGSTINIIVFILALFIPCFIWTMAEGVDYFVGKLTKKKVL